MSLGDLMEWAIGELAARAGISTRTLRHYDAIGLLAPSSTSQSGQRFYDATAVARLQRILLLRDAGMPLQQIAAVLEDESMTEEIAALGQHAERLEADKCAINAKLAAIQHVIEARSEGRDPNPDVLLEGFNDRYEAEVVERWGRGAFEAGNAWWHGKSLPHQQQWKKDSEQLVADWVALATSGADVDSPEAVAMVRRHLYWLAQIPGTPTHEGDADTSIAMVCGLARMYVADPAFQRAFGGQTSAQFVSDALLRHAEKELRQVSLGRELNVDLADEEKAWLDAELER